jgi:hypothetical protein
MKKEGGEFSHTRIKRTLIGEELFGLLHKKTFDIDMPFRIAKWMERTYNGEDVKKEISTYIENYFI